MTDTIIPADQLPRQRAQFIAYGAQPRTVADPNGGDSVQIRPQTYVVYYESISVLSVTESDKSKGVVTVTFDPSSVGLNEPISGHLNEGEPAVAYLRGAAEARRPVAVGIEVSRKTKRASTKAPISPAEPIHALRGCESPSGGKGSMDASRDTIRKVVALVDGHPTQGISSDPREWVHLIDNKDGRITPAGWRFWAPGETWKDAGAIVRAEHPAPAPAAAVAGTGADTDLKAVVADAVSAAFAAHADAARREAEAEAGVQGPLASPRGRAREGRPFDLRTSDGRIALGAPAVFTAGWAFRWAWATLARLAVVDVTVDADTVEEHSAAPTPPTEEAAWELAEWVLRIADKAQRSAYGERDIRVGREDGSYRAAVDWTKWVSTNVHPYPGAGEFESPEARTSALGAWAGQVAPIVTRLMATAGQITGDHLAAVGKAEREARLTPVEAAPEKEQSPPTVWVQAILARLVANPSSAANLAGTVAERGAGDVVVATRTVGGVMEAVCPPPADQAGWEVGKLGGLLAFVAANTGAPTPAAPVPSPAPAPAPVPQPPVPEPLPEGVRGVLESAAKAGTLGQLRVVFESAKAQNILNYTLAVKSGSPLHNPTLGVHRAPGMEPVRLSAIINAHRAHIESGARTAPTAPDPTNQPQPATPVDAQTLADQASVATAPDAVNTLLNTAREAGIGDHQVTVGGISGPLVAYLVNRANQLTRR